MTNVFWWRRAEDGYVRVDPTIGKPTHFSYTADGAIYPLVDIVSPVGDAKPSLVMSQLGIAPSENPDAEHLTGGVKYDQGKRRWDLLPWRATEEIVKVMEFGAKKYGDHNWQKGMKWSRLFSAACRHMFAWWRGEDKDPETGLSHLAHAACCILFALDYVEGKYGEDDRKA